MFLGVGLWVGPVHNPSQGGVVFKQRVTQEFRVKLAVKLAVNVKVIIRAIGLRLSVRSRVRVTVIL